MRRRAILLPALLAGVFLFAAATTRAQPGLDPGAEPGETNGTPAPSQTSRDSRELEFRRSQPTIPQAGEIDAQTYVLGPGDGLQIDLWGRLGRTIPLEVSPEGRVFLPGSGPLDVGGKTLAWARERILRMVSDRFTGVKADVRLVRLRTFKVFLTGFVRQPGAVEANSVMRASEAVALIGLTETASHRNIQVRRRDGTVGRLDLAMFELTGSQQLNPFLADGDVIYVPRQVETLDITGAVSRPGSFELTPTDSVRTLLRLGGGLLPAADPNQVLIVRFRTPSERESLWMSLEELRDGTRNFPLQNGDHVFVQYRSNYHVLPVVGVYGEVERPGTYPIVIGRDRFSDLIRWAGGFRPLANRSAINLIRASGARATDPEFDRLVRLARNEMTESEYAKFQTRLAERTNSFRVDWDRLQQEGADVDPLLQDGDVVRVDQLVSSVRVEGEVRRPGYVDFAAGRDLSEYIDLAGGYTDRASRRAVRVSRSLTGQVIPARSLKSVQPGDFIWVPERRDVDAWGVFRDVVTVGGQIAVIIFTLSR